MARPRIRIPNQHTLCRKVINRAWAADIFGIRLGRIASRLKLPQRLRIGEDVTVYIQSFDISARKISLGLEPSVIVQKQGATTSLADMMKGLFR